MKILEAYEKYSIPPNLQQHMLWVAGLAQIIIENWTGGKLDERAIIEACLFHDAAKIIKFDFSKSYLFGDCTGDIEQLKKVQKEIIAKYGEDDHEATLEICRELGVSEAAIEIIRNRSPFDEKVKWVVEKGSPEIKIVSYADTRISPAGLVSLEERFREIAKREKKAASLMALVRGLERQVQERVKIELADIEKNNVDKTARGLKPFELNDIPQ